MTTFVGGEKGPWRITRQEPVVGDPVPGAAKLSIVEDGAPTTTSAWTLRGVPSYERYVTRIEQNELRARSPALGRPEATNAALIPVRKTAAWWGLPQDERRQIFEERSHHIATGLKYVPAVARQLYQCRDLGQPFDFLTWFEYAPSDATAFEELVDVLRGTLEWRYVERETDIRLALDRPAHYPAGDGHR